MWSQWISNGGYYNQIICGGLKGKNHKQFVFKIQQQVALQIQISLFSIDFKHKH